MRKSCIQHVVIHLPDHPCPGSRSGKVNEFHVEVIGRKLRESSLNSKQQAAVIDRILGSLREREHDGIIK